MLSAPRITSSAPTLIIVAFCFSTTNVLLVIALLWVSLPANEAVTMYVPAAIVALLVSAPLTVIFKSV